MSKKITKKKRSKKYRGKDAAIDKPRVTKVSIPKRSPIGRWWHEHKKSIGIKFGVIATLFIFYLVLSWLIGLIL